MTDRLASLDGPRHKTADKYLSPSAWHGDPVPPRRIGPWGLGQTCWYCVVRRESGGYRAFAAETPERAEAAARKWAEEQGLTIEASS